MGLDQYWLVQAPDNQDSVEEVAYHRKFNALQGWMEQHAVKSGFVEDIADFNCRNYPINKDMLGELKKDIIAGNFKPTPGFFYGPQEIHPEDMRHLLNELIPTLEHYLTNGNIVYYLCSW